MTSVQTHAGQRAVIAVIGNRNAGKSSLLNQLIGQDVSIVSDTLGTTTDAVCKAYEFPSAGPVSFYDTAGLDDTGELGEKRIKATEKIIKKADLILYVIGQSGLDGIIEEQLRDMNINKIKFIPVFNFADAYEPDKFSKAVCQLYQGIRVSAKTGQGIEELKERIIEIIAPLNKDPQLLKNLISPKDLLVMVTPIDSSAPKGRMIMPQVQTLREALDTNAMVLTVKPDELAQALNSLKNPPALVITDSQAVKEVAAIVPSTVPLTTFSMVLARAKFNFKQMADGIEAVKNLRNNDKVLIAEGCSHHISCDDIGRVKIPALLKKYTKAELNIDFASGTDFPEDLSVYKLIIHCGGCVLPKGEINRRLKECEQQNIPVTNYGMIISMAQGVLERVISPLL